jgi:hypothetical protein
LFYYCGGFYFYFYSNFLFFLSLLLTLPSSSSHPYSHPLHFPSSYVKIIALLPNYSFCPFSSLFPPPYVPLPFSSNLSPHYPSLLHTHHLLTNLLYQHYTTPTPDNLWHKHPTIQQQKYTQTHTGATKPSSPLTASLTHPPHLPF